MLHSEQNMQRELKIEKCWNVTTYFRLAPTHAARRDRDHGVGEVGGICRAASVAVDPVLA